MTSNRLSARSYRDPLQCGLVAVAATAICWWITGTSLDLFLSPLLLLAVIAPPLLQNKNVLAALAMILGVIATWSISVFTGSIPIHSWIECSVILVSFFALLFSLGKFLQRLEMNGVIASATITLLALLWLTWPIWLNKNGPVTIHPLFAINSACQTLGIWTEQRVAYQLTTLGQDIPYHLPASIWPATLFHLATASVFITFAEIRLSRKIV